MDMPRLRSRRRAALATLALVLPACGPTPLEAGTAVLLATPVALLVAYLLVWGLHALWRRARPEHRVPLVPALAVLGASLVVGLAAAALAPPGSRSDDWFGVALVTFAPSFLTLWFVAWRVALWRRPARAVNVALAITAVVMVVPALLMVTGLFDGEVAELPLAVWLMPGYYGVPTLVVVGGLYIEAAVRSRRVRGGRPPSAPSGA